THDHPGPSALTYDVPAGSVSVTTMGPVESLGPWLTTSRVYVASWPATNGPLPALSRARSTERRAVAVSVSSLLAWFGSNVRALPVTWFGKVAPSSVPAGIATVTVIAGKLAPVASVSAGLVRVQVIWVVPLPHDHPGPAALAEPMPVGRSSTTV